MTDAARRAEANRLAKKYGKTRDEVLRPKAAKEMLDSRWANQVKSRSTKLAHAMHTGEI